MKTTKMLAILEPPISQISRILVFDFLFSHVNLCNLWLILVLALGLIASVANADFIFGTPVNLGPTVNSSGYELHPDISADGLALYFAGYNRPGGYGDYDIWVTTRATTDDTWATPVNLGPTVNSAGSEWCPRVSADGLSLYFSSTRAGGSGGRDVWVTSRPTKNDPWGKPVNLGPTVNSEASDSSACPSADGLSLFFPSGRVGGLGLSDMWVTTRPTKSDVWGEPVNLGETVNSSAKDGDPELSTDGLALFFYSSRPGGYGYTDLWVTTRKTTEDAWGKPVNLGPIVNSEANEWFPSISRDSSTLYFFSDRPGPGGETDIWQAPVIPIVDFNGDGIVDAADMCIMIDYWGTDESFCDIGPMPWGDGIIDVQDLIALSEHLFKEVDDPTLIAHWKLDEAEGDIAYDSTGVYDGVLNGVPIWQPSGGKVAGALAFDGTDDYVSTDHILDPADGVFSVFDWIKGGAPGQVIISQTDGTNWLLADPSEGKLRTSLLRPAGGRTAPQPLISEFVITDGNWHRIGFVWDGSNRTLYVDDVEVATDTQDSLESSAGGLYIGAGKGLEVGSFFSGLIDDIRIYDRAVTP